MTQINGATAMYNYNEFAQHPVGPLAKKNIKFRNHILCGKKNISQEEKARKHLRVAACAIGTWRRVVDAQNIWTGGNGVVVWAKRV